MVNPPPPHQSVQKPWFLWTAILGACFLAALECWMILSPHWQARDIVPPGDDPVVHLGIITNILAGKGWLIGLPYPPLFHWLVASLAFVTHTSALQAEWMITTGIIAYIPLCVAGVFILRLSEHQSKTLLIGILSAATLFMLSRQPLRAWGDGNYPNMLAEGILIPLLLYSLTLLHGAWNRWVAGGVIILLGLVFTAHAMSILIALATFGIGVLAIDLPIMRKLQLGGSAALLTLFAWLKVVGPTVSIPAIRSILSGQSNIIPGLESSAALVTPLRDFGTFFGEPFLSVSLLLLCLAIALYIVDKTSRYTLFILTTWLGALFLVSRIGGLAVPDRFLRDISYPLIALGAVSMTILARRQFLAALPVVLLLAFIGLRFATFVVNQPGAFAPHPDGIRPIEQRADHATATALQQLAPLIPSNATIITNRTTSYAPFLLNHKAVALGVPSVGNQSVPYYILLGPEPGGSLRSPAESQLYQAITTYLKAIPGKVIVHTNMLSLILVTQKQR